MNKEFDIDLLSIKEGKSFEKEYRITRDFFENRENTDILDADVDVVLHVEKRHGCYMLEFDLVGNLAVACDRCLDPVNIPIDTTYDIMVRHGEEYDDSRDDVLIIPENRTTLDVAPLIYDTLLLEIPLRHVHPDGECNADMLKELEASQK